MSDEAFFQSSLDRDMNDPGLRWLFAEWLEDRCDPRFQGYFWMARFNKRPLHVPLFWNWWTLGMSAGQSSIGEEFEKYIQEFVEHVNPRVFAFHGRIEAEQALCRALLRRNRDIGGG